MNHYDWQAQVNNNLDTSRSKRPSGVKFPAKANCHHCLHCFMKEESNGNCPIRLEDALGEPSCLCWGPGVSTSLPEIKRPWFQKSLSSLPWKPAASAIVNVQFSAPCHSTALALKTTTNAERPWSDVTQPQVTVSPPAEPWLLFSSYH